MEFRCLWFTSTTEYSTWKILLNYFPFPLVHKHYKSMTEGNLDAVCEQTAACFWSEKEYPLTPKIFRDYLANHKKPSLLLLKNAAFAYKAFERGFSHCLNQEEVHNKLSTELVNLLSHYFKPHNKPIVFMQKLYVPVDPQQNEIHFLEFEDVIRIYSDNGLRYIETVAGLIKTPIPFVWLAVQCELPKLNFCKLNGDNLLNTNFIKSLKMNKQQHYCNLLSGKKLKLKMEESIQLQAYIKFKNKS